MSALTDALIEALKLTPEDAPWVDKYTEVVLAAMRSVTRRYLYPVALFRDSWPTRAWFPRGLVALAEFPIKSISKITMDFRELTPQEYAAQPAGYVHFTSGTPLGVTNGMAVEYAAGYDVLPGDLYMALEAILRDLRAQFDASGSSGTGMGMPTKVSIIDVGSVDVGSTASAYQASAMRAAKVLDPLLGPWMIVLDAYKDQVKTFWHTDVRFSAYVGPYVPPPGP